MTDSHEAPPEASRCHGLAPGALARLQGLMRSEVRKVDVHGHRSSTIEDTWARVAPLLDSIGVTRVADITGLDRIGIPVYQAIAPASNDIISTYSGKGLSAGAARVSAVMEALERHCACLPVPVDRIASVNEARVFGWTVLDPREGTVTVEDSYDDDTAVAWCAGYDISAEREVLVAVDAVSMAWPSPPVGEPVHTLLVSNGLASGNNLTEAVIHGLYEAVERDAWTMASAIGQVLSDTLAEFIPGGVDLDVLRPVEVETLPQRLREHVARFAAEGVELQLFMVVSDIDVPTALAVSIEAGSPSPSHLGLGTDADPEIALGRAITEVAQSRAVDFAAGREDVSNASEEVPAWMLDTQRSTDTRPWSASRTSISFEQCRGYASGDIAADLRATVERLRSVGLDRVIVVDLTPPDFPFSVCRVVVPGAESWGADHNKVGDRLVGAWNTVVAEVAARQQEKVT